MEHPFPLPTGSAEHPARMSCAAGKGEVCTAPLDAPCHGKVRQRLGQELQQAEKSLRQEHGSSQWDEGP